MNTVNTVVIGAGPGGYVAAIRLAQLGVDVHLVERGTLGGVCLNIGCIPSKALIHAAHTLELMEQGREMGITAASIQVDAAKLQSWKRSVVTRLTGGVASLCKQNGVHVHQGQARFTSDRSIRIQSQDGASEDLSFEHAIIATGSRPIVVPGFEPDEEHILSSTGALALERVPKHLVVVGGGYIGLELGQMWRKLGAKVTVIEMADTVLPGVERDAVRMVAASLRRSGVKVHTGARALSWSSTETGLTVEVSKGDEAFTVDCDKVLVTVGRRPSAEGLDLQEAGLELGEAGVLVVDDQCRTAQPHIFAIGDITGDPMLAHRASKQGEVAAEVIAGHRVGCDWTAIPAVVFTDPEIASCGMTEEEAWKAGREIKVGRFPFAANGKALSMNMGTGFVKLVSDAEDGQILGALVVGPEASTLISELTLAVEMGALAQDLSMTIHPHPTLGEAIMEAAAHSLGHAIHTLNR